MKIVANATFTALRSVRKPVFWAVLLLALLLYVPNSAFAASGGIMGGGFFSSSEKDNDNSSPKITSSENYWLNNCHDRRSFCYPRMSPMVTNNYYYTSSQSQSHSQDQRESPRPQNSNGSSVGGQRSHTFLDTGLIVITGLIIATILFFVLDLGFSKSDRFIAEASVLTLQVALLGSVRSLQKDLNRIAQTADTSKKEGLTYILRETTLAILRHSAFCISSYSSVEKKRNIEDCEKRFYQLSFEERVKFDEHTLANLNNIKWQIRSEPKRTRFNDEYIVITILVATKGVNKLPAIRSSNDLKEALRKIGSMCSKGTLALEVVWTPQDEQDTLTEREYVKDYPLLRRLI